MFEYSDLNMQVMPDQMQAHWCGVYTVPCLCTRPTPCRCHSNQLTLVPCPALSCRCLSRPLTIPCICLSKPIASVPPRTIKDFTIYEQVAGVLREINDPAELDVLRTELQEAMKHVEIQREVMERTMAPRSEAAFDEAEQALKQQLEQLQRQRDQFRGGAGGAGGGGDKPHGGGRK